MATPVRERDDAEGAAIDAGDGSRSACETPNKARRIEAFVGTPLSAFARRNDLIEAPGGTSGLGSTSGSSVSPSTSTSSRVREDGQALPDPVEALKVYDETVEAMSQPVDQEEDDMDAADEKRHVPSASKDSDDWNANFKTAVHEAGRRLFARSFTSGRSIEDAMKMCFSADETRTQNILAEFDVPSSFNISYKHVMGEALELMSCYLSRVDTRVDLRDYLTEEQSSCGDRDGEPVFVECKVHKCFMSCAPPRSPFCMTRRDTEELVAAFGGNDDAWKLAEKLFDQSRRDRFFDVLIILKDLQTEGRYHIQAVQCKARTHFDAYIDIAKYVGHQFAIYEMAKKVNSLVRLDWVANIFSCKQTEAGGDFELFRKNGRLRTLLYDDMCRREDKIRLAAAMASHAFGSKDGEVVPPRPRKKPREFQTQALERLRVAREDLELRGGSVVAATGAGKSLIAFMDAMATMYDECGKSLTRLDQIGMVWTCKRIHLLEQSIENFKDHEDRELADFAKRQYEYKIPKLFYYLVCSKQETIDTPYPNAIRRLTVPQLFSVLLLHRSRGELSRCRFFTTVEGGSGFWYQLIKYIRVSRGINEPLDNPENPLVNMFIVDEAHEVTGNGGKQFQLVLNIPARWRVCYSATPVVEHHRASLIRKRIEGSAEIDDDAAFEDVSKQRTQKKRVEDRTPEELFPNEYFKKLTDLGICESDSEEELVKEFGLGGYQLLSKSLQFVPLESAANVSEFESEDAIKLVQQLQEAYDPNSAEPSVDDFSEALRDRQLVIFETRKEMERGMCTCLVASGKSRDAQCADHCAKAMFKPEGDTAAVIRYRCNFDFWYRNFLACDLPLPHSAEQKKVKIKSDCVVLGWDKHSRVLSIRLGGPRGFACHDFTDFGVRNGTNLIGAPVFTYTFAEAFRSPHNIIARPFVVTYRLKTPSAPMNDSRHKRLKRIFGIGTKTGTRGPHPTFEELNKVGLQISFNVSDSPVVATTQDYATAMTIYRMIERREASKIMVFCSKNEDCRRCLALFQVLLRQRIDEAKSHGDQALVRCLNEVHSAHIYASWDRNNGVTEKMEEVVKRKLLHTFRMGKTEVLFNANYLSTGIDIPCTDAVVLTSKSKVKTLVLQRWGRALRSVKTQPNKRGVLALIMSDPRESSDDRTNRRKFMGLDTKKASDFCGCHSDFRLMYRTAECAAHHSNRIIGECDKITAARTTQRKASGNAKTKSQNHSVCPGDALTVTPDVERTLCDMFDIVVRDLLQ
tara:strand:- start:190 stop:3945 length:3756 start_codon:yes stop_codon:yes gene_type:complete